MDKSKDLSLVLISDPCKEKLMQVQTTFGTVDINSITEEVNWSEETGFRIKSKDEDWFEIGDYARANDNSAALRKCKLKFPGLKKITIRSLKTRLTKEIKDASKEQREVTQSLKKYSKLRGRPYLLGDLDVMVKSYIKALSSPGALMNSSLAIFAGKALIKIS